MENPRQGQFLPYAQVAPGFEAMYTGQRISAADEMPLPPEHYADEWGNVYRRWPLWTWTGMSLDWGPEIRQINAMQERLGPLDDETRHIRAHIASLAHCDNGFPVTMDELLQAIGSGKLREPAFHNGCYWCIGAQGTQPGQVESMSVIEAILSGYLAGKVEDELVRQYPQAAGFTRRAYEWLGPASELTAIQKLLLERMLLPFEFFTRRNPDRPAVFQDCFGEGGRGVQLDAQIAALAGLPRIYPNYKQEYRQALQTISDPQKKELYKVAAAIAHGAHELSDCHHSTFRWIENWIHGIGAGAWDIPTRKRGTERERLGRLLFGYVLALDEWLQGMPMQFLLLDLGHVDLGFDPKNEILRVYAYLGGERTPLKEWLTACLWYPLYVSLRRWNIHKALLERGTAAGFSLRGWMDATLAGAS